MGKIVFMEYNKIIAVTGLPGLYELLSSKADGAIVRSLDDKATRFVASRSHNFSHLETIEVYTVRDNVNLVDILKAMEASAEKLPGIIMALAGSIGFALGTVLAKKLPLRLPPITATAWQIGLGCFPVAVVGLLIETSHWQAVTKLGWLLVVYSTVVQFCIAYVAWFAALARLPASVAAIGTMAVPVIGVVASALALHEPLGTGQIAALVFTLAGVALAARS